MSARVIAFIEKFCIVPEGKLVGQPFKLDAFQRRFIREVYDNKAVTKRGILSIAKKNGKSGLISALLLAHLVGPMAVRNAQIVSGAMSRDQAGLVFSLAAKIVELSPRLREIVRIIRYRKALIGVPRNTEYRALSADGRRAQGISPILVILDEIGQVKGPNSEFVSALLTAQGAYADALQLVISTQASSDADLLSLMIDEALTGANPQLVCHLYAAPDGCALDDESAWKAANPALGKFRSIEDVRFQAGEAKRMPTQEASFRNLILNQRIDAETPFIARAIWLENSAPPRPLAGQVVYGGLDLSSVSDLTALVLATEQGDVHATFWLPAEGLREKSQKDRTPWDVWADKGFLETTPGRAIEYAFVAKHLRRVFSELRVAALAFDRFAMRFLRPYLVAEGFTEDELAKFIPFGQGFVSMSPALRELEARLLMRQIRHGNHPVLTLCARNAVVKTDPAGNRKLDKSKRTRRIDGMVSLAMAIGAMPSAVATPEPQLLFV